MVFIPILIDTITALRVTGPVVIIIHKYEHARIYKKDSKRDAS